MLGSKSVLRNLGLLRRDAIGLELRDDFASRLTTLGVECVLDYAQTDELPITALYAPIGSEPDTLPLAEALHSASIPLCLPVDECSGSPLVYRSWVPGDRLTVGPLSIREPLDNAPLVEPDVLFIPFAAFDRRGYRIGYGVGNVDRTLRRLRARKDIRTIGVGYSVQEEPTLPIDAHDEALDIIVTERDVHYCL